MLNPVPATPNFTRQVTHSLLASSDEETARHAVVSREPDPQIAEQDLAWWLGLQERLEMRADLKRAGLL